MGQEFHQSGSVDPLFRTGDVKQARIPTTLQSFRYLRRGDGQTLGQIFGLRPRPILNGEFEKKRNVLALHGSIVSSISNLEIGNLIGLYRHSTLNRIGTPKIWCMFWCMFRLDLNANQCDIMQDRNCGQVLYSVQIMRISAFTCGLLQQSEIWTQNPPTVAVMGVRPPLPAPALNLPGIIGLQDIPTVGLNPQNETLAESVGDR